MKDDRGIVARIISVLGAFADGETALAICQLSERLNLPASSVHRLLEQLVALDVIERANFRRYRIGPELFRISTRVERKFRVADLARPLMQKLSAELNETCVLSVLMRSRQQRLRVAKLDPPLQPLKVRIQTPERYSLVWGAAGRAILAHMTPDEVEAAFDTAASVSAAPSFTLHWLIEELERVRARGFAFAQGEVFSPDTIAVASPFFGPNQQVAGSVTVVMPVFRFSEGMLDSLAATLTQYSEQLSQMLGATAAPRAQPSEAELPPAGKTAADKPASGTRRTSLQRKARHHAPPSRDAGRCRDQAGRRAAALFMRSSAATCVTAPFEKGPDDAREQPDDRNAGVSAQTAGDQH